MRGSLIIAAACIFANVPRGVAVAADASSTPAPAVVPASAPSSRPLLVDRVATDPSEIVRAGVGQTFAIALRANRSTGFSWEVAQPPAPSVETLGSAYETRTPGIGGGGQEFWVFRALSTGEALVTLRYVRPSGNGPSLMERAVTFHVEIVP